MNNSGLIRGLEEILTGLDQALEKISNFTESSLIPHAEKRRLERLAVTIDTEHGNLKNVLLELRKDTQKSMSPEFVAYVDTMSSALYIITISHSGSLERVRRENLIPVDEQSNQNPLIKWANDVQSQGRALTLSPSP